MGSLTEPSDPDSPGHETIVPAYISSRSALNAITVELAKLLRGTAITVNSTCPAGAGAARLELCTEGAATVTPS